jgi:hypothetical protein
MAIDHGTGLALRVLPRSQVESAGVDAATCIDSPSEKLTTFYHARTMLAIRADFRQQLTT